MAHIVLSLVSGVIRGVTGMGKHHGHQYYNQQHLVALPAYPTQVHYTPCTCQAAHYGQPTYCAICDPCFASRRGCRRERKRERRAAKHARKACRWSGGRYPAVVDGSVPVAVYHATGCEPAMLGMQGSVSGVPEQRKRQRGLERRASLDEEELGAPPVYEQGNWEARRSVEVPAAPGQKNNLFSC